MTGGNTVFVYSLRAQQLHRPPRFRHKHRSSDLKYAIWFFENVCGKSSRFMYPERGTSSFWSRIFGLAFSVENFQMKLLILKFFLADQTVKVPQWKTVWVNWIITLDTFSDAKWKIKVINFIAASPKSSLKRNQTVIQAVLNPVTDFISIINRQSDSGRSNELWQTERRQFMWSSFFQIHFITDLKVENSVDSFWIWSFKLEISKFIKSLSPKNPHWEFLKHCPGQLQGFQIEGFNLNLLSAEYYVWHS